MTSRQELIESRLAERESVFTEFATLAKLVKELRDAGASWSLVATVVDRLTSVRVSGQTLRAWFDEVSEQQ